MKKKQVLIQAQKSGSILKVTYKSGSQPNHAREIIPLKIENDKVLAKCLNSNTDKSFLISDLKLLTDEQYDTLAKWDPDFIPVTDYELYELQRKKKNNLFRYLYIVLVIIAIVFVYVIVRSKTK